jgi:para-nitrobenzyl esterase
MKTTRWVSACAVLALAASAATFHHDTESAAAISRGAPTTGIENGAVRGFMAGGADVFRGLPYAAPPTGARRWRAPQPAASWSGVRDATVFAPSCPQPANLFAPAGPQSEDCLYVNVYAPAATNLASGHHPVMVWIHGGGFVEDGARNYEPTQMAADGTVVVTVDYRLGALGFLAHPALASRPGGPAGNYGLMDQQAALGWIQRNISAFGGDPHNVTISGESAGGTSVLMHLVATGSRGLFQRAIVQSGAFALDQTPLASAEAFGQSFAAKVGCANETAACLRAAPLSRLLEDFPGAAIPGVIDGDVLKESIRSALTAGRFARVPFLNGHNHLEEAIFVLGTHSVVSGGTFVGITSPVTVANYQSELQTALDVSSARAAAIAALYPAPSDQLAPFALSAAVGDANFACPDYQVDTWTAPHVPTFAYEFDDDNAPPRYAPIPVATHGSEIQYLYALPNAPIPGPLNPTEQQLSRAMQAAWASFAANGDPSTAALPWPSFNSTGNGMQLVAPTPQIDTTFAERHHCSFWAAG